MSALTTNFNYITMNRVFYNEQEEPIVLSKALFDLLLKQEHFSELLALYSFYYYTAKWQRTNTPKAINSYVSNALGWSENKVTMYKTKLIQLNLIENYLRKDESNNKIRGHYIKVNFVWSRNSISDLHDSSTSQKTHTVEILGGINALNSTNKRNALSTNKTSLENEDSTLKTKNITPNQFNEFWELYPKKVDKGKALTSWNKLCNKKDKPTWRDIRKAIIEQKKTPRWSSKQFIPLPTTWLNQSRWLDDPAEMTNFDYVSPGFSKTSDNRYKFEPGFEELGNLHRKNHD